MVIKMVSLLPEPVETNINMENEGKVGPVAVKTLLTGLPGDKKLAPVTSEITVGKEFPFTMPAGIR
jgi:hypothetical protein